MVKKSIKESETKSEFETDFGDRKVSHINQSRMVAIPKMALKNCCGTADDLTVSVSMVQKDGEKFLKLTPICESKIDDEDIDKEIDEDEDDEDV